MPDRQEAPSQALRRELPDWWLGASAMPQAARADWLHILSVVLEVERIPQRAREPMIVQIRLAWWRELIEEIYAGQVPRPHPLAARLQDIIARYDLPQTLWDGWLSAMAERFDPQENADLASTEEWLFAIAAHLLGISIDTPREAEPWQELGRIWTLLHGLRMQAFGGAPDVTLAVEAASTALRRHMAEPDAAKARRFWRVQWRIARHYLKAASKATSAAQLQIALAPSRVLLPLKLMIGF